jgi:hypothetical protein
VAAADSEAAELIETESPRVIRHTCAGVTDKDKRKPIQSKATLS